MAPVNLGRVVSERARERESFRLVLLELDERTNNNTPDGAWSDRYRYDPTLLEGMKFNDTGEMMPRSELSTSKHIVLTALAQLGACRTSSSGASISLFDKAWQYIIAEASPTMPLEATVAHDELWICGTAIPRCHSVCDALVVSCNPADFDVLPAADSDELPIAVISDIKTEARYSTRPCYLPGCPARFYAMVPIRSRRGINIGVYCVTDEKPRPKSDWTDDYTHAMRDISRCIMDYIESKRCESTNTQAFRMIRSLGSFMEESKACVSVRGSRTGRIDRRTHNRRRRPRKARTKSSRAASEGKMSSGLGQDSGDGGSLQAAEGEPSTWSRLDGRPPSSPREPDGCDENKLCPGSEGSEPLTNPTAEEPQEVMNSLFRQAAGFIRDSIQVDGVLFLDASPVSFSGLVDEDAADDSTGATTPFSLCAVGDSVGPSCGVLGFSSAEQHDENQVTIALTMFPQKLLSSLLRRYPNGKIFEREQGAMQGALEQSSDSSDDEQGTWRALDRPAKLHAPRDSDAAVFSVMFPGAHSVSFAPIWDLKRERYFAGGFAYTMDRTQTFSQDMELGYLRVFGTIAMAENLRLDALVASKAKSDALGSLSHELRSPLHGIVLGVELLHDTSLDVFQGNVLHTLETCSRTLLDSLDHLLDFAKISKFAKAKAGARGLTGDSGASVEAGMVNLVRESRLDVLAEEVVESVFTGFNFQHKTIAQLPSGIHTLPVASLHRCLDALQGLQYIAPILGSADGPSLVPSGRVSIYINIEPREPWVFSTAPGAIRRVIMNLVGNSLKYTRDGMISLSLSQDVSVEDPEEQVMKILVSDTGRGISPEYLRTDLFKPFSQEDQLSPGTGLGLSMVKKITKSLGGEVTVQSCLGLGTSVLVALPLTPLSPEDCSTVDVLETQVRELRGLRVRLLGFGKRFRNCISQDASAPGFVELEHMESLCEEWVQMHVVGENESDVLAPDVVLCTEEYVDRENGSEHSGRSPTIVVCDNAMAAHRRSVAQGGAERDVFEFISQPIGPRKLANVVLVAVRRWKESQSSAGDKVAHNEIASAMGKSATKTGDAEMSSLSVAAASGTSDAVPTPSKSAARPRPAWHRTETLAIHPAVKNTIAFLLVDDNDVNLKFLSLLMKKLGSDFTTAANGQEAVTRFHEIQDTVKCIFMDINMPIMDGFEAARKIRRVERDMNLEPCAIIALTGSASADAQQEAFVSGIDLFLTKPVKFEELRAIIDQRQFLTKEKGKEKGK